MRLPFAPHPHPGEALSSWVARLAAHNFVDIETFWAWLTGEQADDVKPSAATIQSLSEVSGVPRADIEKMARPLRRAPPSHLLQLSSATGLRGGACATCLVEADAAGRDHGLPTLAASIWTVTCPRHGERLFDLRSFNWRLDRGRLRLSHGVDHGVGAGPRTSSYASELLRACEAAFIRAFMGQPAGSVWRTRKPREFLACVEALAAPVFWRAGAGGPAWPGTSTRSRATAGSLSMLMSVLMTAFLPARTSGRVGRDRYRIPSSDIGRAGTAGAIGAARRRAAP